MQTMLNYDVITTDLCTALYNPRTDQYRNMPNICLQPFNLTFCISSSSSLVPKDIDLVDEFQKLGTLW